MRDISFLFDIWVEIDVFRVLKSFSRLLDTLNSQWHSRQICLQAGRSFPCPIYRHYLHEMIYFDCLKLLHLKVFNFLTTLRKEISLSWPFYNLDHYWLVWESVLMRQGCIFPFYKSGELVHMPSSIFSCNVNNDPPNVFDKDIRCYWWLAYFEFMEMPDAKKNILVYLLLAAGLSHLTVFTWQGAHTLASWQFWRNHDHHCLAHSEITSVTLHYCFSFSFTLFFLCPRLEVQETNVKIITK